MGWTLAKPLLVSMLVSVYELLSALSVPVPLYSCSVSPMSAPVPLR
jgi:hypothetical protein